MATETYIADSLFGGAVMPVPSKGETLAVGENRARGTVLGKRLRALGAYGPDPGNTGEGDIAHVALSPGCKIGTYTMTCLTVGPPSTWSVLDPDGVRLADAEAEVNYQGFIDFTIEAYGVAFAVGDIFTVVVGAGNGHLELANSGEGDGTEDIYGILAEDTDASLAAKECPVYLGGEFSEDALVFNTLVGDTADTFRDQARERGIIFRTNVPS